MRERVFIRPGEYVYRDVTVVRPGPVVCRHRGAEGERVPCPGAKANCKTRTWSCAIHSRCHINYGKEVPGIQDCSICPDYQPPPYHFQWISTARLLRDAITLAGMLPADCSGIVGVPRSGMIPASVIATHLHLPLWTLEGQTLRQCLVPVSRGNGIRGGSGHFAVVDDTTFTGAAMCRARVAVGPRPAIYCAVYVNSLRPESKTAVDLFAVELPAPHLLEWNWANNGPMAGRWADVPAYGTGMAMDLDGIIVHDDHSGGLPGTPYMVPRAYPCKLICTGRPESSRVITAMTLRRLGVSWQRLEMLPQGGDPQNHVVIATHKARHFAASGCGLFMESNPEQAEIIHRISRKPVICPRVEKVWSLT